MLFFDMDLLIKRYLFLLACFFSYNLHTVTAGDNNRYFPDGENKSVLSAGQFADEGYYDEAISRYRASIPVLRSSDHKGALTGCYLSLSELYHTLGMADSSAYFLHLADQQLTGIREHRESLVIRTYMLKARMEVYKKKFRQALDTLMKVLPVAEQSNVLNNRMKCMYYGSLGNIYRLNGFYNEAGFYIHEAEKYLGDIMQHDPLVAMEILRIKMLYFYRAGNDIGTVIHRLDSIVIAIPNPDHPALIRYCLSRIYYDLINNKPEDAYDKLQVAKRIISNIGEKSSLKGDLLFRYGLYYEMTGESGKALEHYLIALEYAMKYPDLTQKIPKIALSIRSIYYSCKAYKKTKKYIQLALQYETNPDDLYTDYLLAGNSELMLDHKEKAMYYYEKAERAFSNIPVRDSILLTFLYDSKEHYYRKYGGYEERLENLRNLYGIYERHAEGHRANQGIILMLMASYFDEIEQHGKAARYIQNALLAVEKDFFDSSLYANPAAGHIENKELTATIMLHKARILHRYNEQEGNLQASLACYERVAEVYSRLLLHYGNEHTGMNYYKRTEKSVLGSIRVSWELYEKTGDNNYLKKIFRFAEYKKAAYLLFAIHKDRAGLHSRVPDSVLTREAEFSERINRLNHELTRIQQQQQISDHTYEQTLSELITLKLQHDELVRMMENTYPDYYNMKYRNEIPKVKTIRDKLKPHQAMIQYALVDDQIYTVLLTCDSIYGNMQVIDTGLFQDIRSLRQHLANHDYADYSREQYEGFILTAHRLYRQLIEPVHIHIENKSLIIIPDEELNLISFEVLLSDNAALKTPGTDYSGLPYLVKNHPVSYAFSGSVLEKLSGRRNRVSRALGVAPGYSMTEVAFRESNSLQSLQGALEEVENVTDFFRGTVLTGEHATESRFKQKAGHYSILHVASHTRLDDENPLFSGLVFTESDSSKEDGILHTYEIYSLSLKADLVVLSGCSTGSGKLRKGEGVLSLARGFVYAGCPGVVLTQWQVADQASAELMDRFYAQLAQKQPRDVALQQAKISYMKSADPVKQHPCYWAGYVLYGDTSPVYRPNCWIWIIAVVAGLAVMIIFLVRRRQLG